MHNDTLQLIDLACLDLADAQAVTKQKIFDLACHIRQMKTENYSPG